MAYQFASKVCGIPCIINVDHYFRHSARISSAHNFLSDLDFDGYEEIEYSVLDRKGHPAAWLERKVTTEDHFRITAEISDVMREEREEREAMMGSF